MQRVLTLENDVRVDHHARAVDWGLFAKSSRKDTNDRTGGVYVHLTKYIYRIHLLNYRISFQARDM